jgi:hypothetical protein
MAHLVAAELTGVAVVSADYTTVIDWVYIDDCNTVSATVFNATGDDISGYIIQYSNDGETVSGTQTIANTIPQGEGLALAALAYTTYHFIRIRAKTSSGTATATAVVVCVSKDGHVCTLTDVRQRVGYETANTTDDDLIIDIERGVAAAFDRYCNRTLIDTGASITEYYKGGADTLVLASYPVISITSVKEASDYDFTNADALTVSDDYRSVDDKGILKRLSTRWLDGEDTVQVVYRGGYQLAGTTPETGETALPNDIREAAIQQVVYWLRRRHDLGLSSTSAQGMSISKDDGDLLPSVKMILDRYKRYAL